MIKPLKKRMIDKASQKFINGWKACENYIFEYNTVRNNNIHIPNIDSVMLEKDKLGYYQFVKPIKKGKI